MKKLLYPLFTLLILFTVGCGDDDDSNPLVGVWVMTTKSFFVENTSETFTYDSTTTNNETMILAEDGTYSSSGASNGLPYNDNWTLFSGSGSWSSTSNKLTIMEDEETLILDFSISGSTLTLIGSDTINVEVIKLYNRVITTTYTKS